MGKIARTTSNVRYNNKTWYQIKDEILVWLKNNLTDLPIKDLAWCPDIDKKTCSLTIELRHSILFSEKIMTLMSGLFQTKDIKIFDGSIGLIVTGVKLPTEIL